MATHSSARAWEIPWTEEPGRLQSMGSWRVGHDWVASLSLFTFMHWRRKWQPTPVFLPGESQGWEPGGLPSMGSHRVGHDWRDLAAAAAVAKLCLTLCNPMDYSLHGSSVYAIVQVRNWSGLPFPSPGDLPNPWIEPGSPAGLPDVSVGKESTCNAGDPSSILG